MSWRADKATLIFHKRMFDSTGPQTRPNCGASQEISFLCQSLFLLPVFGSGLDRLFFELRLLHCFLTAVNSCVFRLISHALMCLKAEKLVNVTVFLKCWFFKKCKTMYSKIMGITNLAGTNQQSKLNFRSKSTATFQHFLLFLLVTLSVNQTKPCVNTSRMHILSDSNRDLTQIARMVQWV